jgi:diguanylate cyclase (GGDEF)-like protein/PAS domain S-box-containing protein
LTYTNVVNENDVLALYTHRAEVDLNANIIQLNPFWIEFFKSSGPEKQSVLNMIEPSDRARFNSLFAQAIEGHVCSMESIRMCGQDENHPFYVRMERYVQTDGEHGVQVWVRPLDPDVDAQERLFLIDQKLSEQSRLNQLLSDISTLFVSLNSTSFEERVHKALALCGELVRADRVYIFKHDHINQVTNNVFEWCNEGIEPQIDELQNTPMALFPDWMEAHQQDISIYYYSVSDLDPSHTIRHILEPQGIKSIITLPIFVEQQLYGFIGFDFVQTHHHYSDFEKRILREVVKVFSVAVSRVEQERAFVRLSEQFRTILLSAAEAIIVTDDQGRVTLINEYAAALIQTTPDATYQKSLDDVLSLREDESDRLLNPVQEAMKRKAFLPINHDVNLVVKGGSERVFVEGSASPFFDLKGACLGVVLVLRDVTEARFRLKSIEYLSFHDVLTGMHNRRYVEEHYADYDHAAALPLTVMMVDLDRLKQINDRHGHDLGDAYLKAAAQTLLAFTQPHELCGRMGGDEFIVIMPNTNHEEALERAMAMKSSFMLGSTAGVAHSLSFGLGVRLDMNQTLDQALKESERKMYLQKALL